MKPDKTVTPVNFTTAKRRLGDKDRVKLDRNTYLERRSDNRIAVILHATDIVTYAPTYTELNSGGWHTMTTRSRMEDYIPMSIRADRNGWALYPNVELPCFCTTASREHGTGIVVNGSYKPGLAIRYTGSYDENRPIYEYAVCSVCKGTAKRVGPDWASGGYGYFDGIRIKPNGSKLMANQPNKPKGMIEPVVTVSGWSGSRQARRQHEPFYDPAA